MPAKEKLQLEEELDKALWRKAEAAGAGVRFETSVLFAKSKWNWGSQVRAPSCNMYPMMSMKRQL
jgi:hypothetical protein